MRTKALLTLLLPLALASCSNRYFNGERHFGLEFEKECALSGGREMMEVFGGGGVYVVDSLLVVTGGNQAAGYFWNVYSRNSGKFIKSMLRHGRGPSEVLYPAYNGQYEYEDGDIVAYFYDSGLSKVLKVNITESLGGTDDVIEDVCGLGYDSYPYYIDSDGKTISSLYVQEEGALSLDGMMEDGGVYCSEIHVFDWNGKAVARIIPDKKITSFDVDPTDSIIYCITDEEKLLLYLHRLT